MLKPDLWITEKAVAGMIDPFVADKIHKIGKAGSRSVLSFGLSSYGYDLTLSPTDFRVYTGRRDRIIDPKNFDPDLLMNIEIKTDETGSYFIIPANTYALGVTNEKLVMPQNTSGLIIGKSTYARCGLIMNTTTIEAGWQGFPTLEISNSASSDAKCYAGEGIAQIHFFESDDCELTYQGKYQSQSKKVTLPR